MPNDKSDQIRLGFLTAIQTPDKGQVGGLLVTNQNGRPLEFQCTLPVRPNPTQELLYGPTLNAFLLGELIGGTLIDKASVKPHLIMTDNAHFLELRNHTDLPVAMVSRSEKGKGKSAETAATPAGNEVHVGATEIEKALHGDLAALPGASAPEASHPNDGEAASSASETDLKAGRYRLRFHTAHKSDAERFESHLQKLPKAADLVEPLERVREALAETCKHAAAK